MPPCGCGKRHSRTVVAHCHPYAPVAVRYDDGVLTVSCGACTSHVFSVRVERRPAN